MIKGGYSNKFLAAILFALFLVALLPSQIKLQAASGYDSENFPFDKDKLTLISEKQISDGTYKFSYADQVIDYWGNGRTGLDKVIKDYFLFYSNQNFPMGGLDAGKEIRYLLAINRDKPSEGKVYYSRSDGTGWQPSTDFTLKQSGGIQQRTTREMKLPAWLASDSGDSINSGLLSTAESVLAFFTASPGNSVKLTNSIDGSELASFLFTGSGKTESDARGITLLPLMDTKTKLSCPGEYTFAYHSEKNAANQVAEGATGGNITESWIVDGSLKFSIDSGCIVRIPESYTVGNLSPINNQPVDSGLAFYIDTTAVKISALDTALSSAIRTVAGFVQESTKFVMNGINSLLTETANYVVGNIGDSSDSRGVLGPWTAMRNIGLSLLVLALIIIAFANVLQIDIEQYGLGRMIPKIIISIFMAMASWVIVVFFFDFTQALQQQAIGLVGGTNGLSALGNMTIDIPSTGDILGKMGSLLLLIAIWVGKFFCGLIPFCTMIIRTVILSLYFIF